MTKRFSGKKLRAERIKARMSIENLASNSGIDSEHIFGLESGTHRPRGATQLALADALGVRLDALHSDDTPE